MNEADSARPGPPPPASPSCAPPARAPLGAFRAALRWAEFLLIFFAAPALVAVFLDPAERFRGLFAAGGVESLFDAGRAGVRLIIPLLLLAAGLVALALARDPTFDNRRLWNWPALRADLPRILGLFAVGAAAMLAVAWALAAFTDVLTFTRGGVETSAFLRLPREAPIVLVIIALAYPWFSAYPQEIIHRAFFFHRYGPLFPSTPAMLTANTLAFAWLHVPFWSLEAILLTAPGGLLFAWTYLRTRSTLAAGMEHALYGFWAFFTGLGWFVFTGSIGT